MRVLISLVLLVVLGVASLAVAVSHDSACGSASPVALRQPMQAAVHRCYGSADVVRIESIERPVPSDHGVLVRVHASSINPLDWHLMHGEPYLVRANSGWGTPKDPSMGTDFAGTVVAVGRLVTRFKPGDEVFGAGHAAFAQYLRTPENAAVALIPAKLSFEQAAAAPVAGITALQALRDHGQLRAGQKVLINGAGGGVGTFAVQIAKSLGADVTAVTNSRSLELLRSLGADHVIDYSRQDFTLGTARYDVILDMSGNHSLSACQRVMTASGIYVFAGNTSKGSWAGPMTGLGRAWIAAKFVNRKVVAFMAEPNPADLAILAQMLQTGTVKPVIDRQYRFDQIAAAIRYQETEHARGKVVVTID
ncbi:MAG TPA: NAD(P)-dependent alcohol dehydrogenase [Steroidobacteraceae bacterium]